MAIEADQGSDEQAEAVGLFITFDVVPVPGSTVEEQPFQIAQVSSGELQVPLQTSFSGIALRTVRPLYAPTKGS